VLPLPLALSFGMVLAVKIIAVFYVRRQHVDHLWWLCRCCNNKGWVRLALGLVETLVMPACQAGLSK
jgi:hypothetical protein